MCELSAQSVRLDEVGERALAVDLDDRKPLAIPGLEVGVIRDVHLLQLEADVGSNRLHGSSRRRAEVASLGVEEDDAGYGYSPRVRVASETRWTARPYAAILIVVDRPS